MLKINLLYPDRDYKPVEKDTIHLKNLFYDLEIEYILSKMANNDKFIYKIVKDIFSNFETDIKIIKYRQEIIKDALKNEKLITELYQTTIDTLKKEKKGYFFLFTKNPSSIVYNSTGKILSMIDGLKKIFEIADKLDKTTIYPGLKNFCKIIKSNLNEKYLNRMEKTLAELQFKKGILIGATVGFGNMGKNYTLLKSSIKKGSKSHTFYLSNKDDAGFQILGSIKKKALTEAATYLSEAADNIKSFFINLKTQIAFYVGTINLFKYIENLNFHFCFSEFSDNSFFRAKELYDLSLLIARNQKIVSNDINAMNKKLILITGANQGGKTTALRSIGIA